MINIILTLIIMQNHLIYVANMKVRVKETGEVYEAIKVNNPYSKSSDDDLYKVNKGEYSVIYLNNDVEVIG